MSSQGSLAVIDLTGILNHEDIDNFRLQNVFAHYFSNEMCYFSFAVGDNVVLILYDCGLNLIASVPSYDSIVLEFPSSSGSVSCMIWLRSTLVIGFETGYLVAFSKDGSCIFESKYYDSAILSIKYAEDPGDSFNIWVLYDLGYFANFSATITPTSLTINRMTKYKLVDQTVVRDFVIFWNTNIGRDSNNTPVYNVFVGGANSTLSLYNFGGPQQFQHFGKLAHYVKEKVVHVFSKTVLSLFESGKQHISDDVGSADLKEYNHAMTSILDIKDSKRMVLRMIGEKELGVIVLADNIGRVLLYDTKLNCVIRIWKGMRDARICWTNRSIDGKLCLSIYAPQTGLINIYGMRHGPCLQTIPLGLQCHVFYSRNISDKYE